jgi:hypothetical protein
MSTAGWATGWTTGKQVLCGRGHEAEAQNKSVQVVHLVCVAGNCSIGDMLDDSRASRSNEGSRNADQQRECLGCAVFQCLVYNSR